MTLCFVTLRRFLLLLALLMSGQALAFQDTADLARLPPQARATLALIHQGGPFPYRRDGIVFGNYEKRLPFKPRGYYHEYTVPTPGIGSRGARRIIAGAGPGRDVRTSGEYWYSDDHYQSFTRIRE